MIKKIRIAISVFFTLGLCVVFALPVLADSPETYYPDAAPEVSSVDGFAEVWYDEGSGVNWDTIHDHVGTSANDNGNAASSGFRCDTVQDKYRDWRKVVMTFDTSALPDVEEITGVVLRLYVVSILNEAGLSPAWNIYSSAPNSDVAVVAGDFDCFGSVAFASAKTSGELVELQYNEWVFNQAGMNAVSRTGKTRLGLLEANYDVADIEPSWVSHAMTWLNIYLADYDGGSCKPELVVTYGEENELLTFTATSEGGAYALLEWSKTGGADVTVRVSSDGYPTDNESGELVYSGGLTEYKYPCLAGTAKTFFFGAFMVGSDNLTASIGGEDVEMSIVLPTGFYVLMAGLVLLFISFFLKSPLIYLAVIPCMFGVLFEPAFKDLWFQSGCCLVIVWCALAFFKKMSEGGTG